MMEIERNGFAGRIVPLDRPALIGELFVSVSKKSLLARRSAEIGAYFARPEYAQELALLLEEHHRRYAQSQPAEPERRPGPR